MTVRYAIYFAPGRDSPLWQVGCRWLGRDPETGAELAPPAVPQRNIEGWRAATASARRYGFHATLKAPFRLAVGRTEGELVQAIDAFAAGQRAFALPRLEVAELGEFLALRPAETSDRLVALAAQCVTQLDVFRRAPQPDETARRLASGLTPRQTALLAQWGYPFVLDEYRFHLTLTDRLAADMRAELEAWLAQYLRAALEAPVLVDQVALFIERQAGGEFVLARRFALCAAKE